MSPPPALELNAEPAEDTLSPALLRFIEALAEAQARADYAAARADRDNS